MARFLSEVLRKNVFLTTKLRPPHQKGGRRRTGGVAELVKTDHVGNFWQMHGILAQV